MDDSRLFCASRHFFFRARVALGSSDAVMEQYLKALQVVSEGTETGMSWEDLQTFVMATDQRREEMVAGHVAQWQDLLAYLQTLEDQKSANDHRFHSSAERFPIFAPLTNRDSKSSKRV